MSLEAVPYTVLILLVELSVGGMAVLLGLDMRGLVAKSYLKLSTAIVLIGAGLTLLPTDSRKRANQGEER